MTNFSTADERYDMLYRRMNIFCKEFLTAYKIYSDDKKKSNDLASTDLRFDSKRLNMLLIAIKRELDD